MVEGRSMNYVTATHLAWAGSAVLLLIGFLGLGRLLLPHPTRRLMRRGTLLDGPQLTLGVVLTELRGASHHICPQVPAHRLIERRSPDVALRREEQRLLAQEVDFALCDKRSWQPQLAVLLVPEREPPGASHPSGKEPPNEPPLARLLARCGLAVLCISPSQLHDKPAIERALQQAFSASHHSS